MITPLTSGDLLTKNGNYESNVGVNSPWWILEGLNGAKPIGGEEGAWTALAPSFCGADAVCLASLRQDRNALDGLPSWLLCLGAGPAIGLCLAAAFFGKPILQGLGNLAYGVYNLVAGYDIATLTNAHASGVDKFLAVLDLASNLLVIVPVAGDELEAAKIAEKALNEASDVEVRELTFEEADALALRSEGCSCFPGATGVLTPHGLVAISSLHAGDQVLAENPATGKVESEKVQTVIDDGVQPLMEIRLSDGSTLSVTTDHPFYVENGPSIIAPAWVPASELRTGDRLRTADGEDVTVVGLRYHVGNARVYTLIIAADHDFFVGSADVLVHNGICSTVVRDIQANAPAGLNVTTVTRAQGNGFVVNISYSGKSFVARIMASGGGRTYYWRLSRLGKGTIDVTGAYSSDRAATHINIGPNAANEIINAIVENVRRYP